MRYDFASDNTAGMAPEALDALTRANAGFAKAYGADEITARAAEIIEGAATLRELTAYDVMVPRTGVKFLSAERSLEHNLELVESRGHSRFPCRQDL